MIFGKGLAVEQNVWDNSIDQQTKERYIPVELGTGVQWDGNKRIENAEGRFHFRHRSRYEIKGPIEWDHPVMGRKFMVYERINLGRDGVQWQMFTINEEKNGLGRVYDARAGTGYTNVFGRP